MCAKKLLICKAQQAYIQTEPQDAEVLVSADVVQQTDVSWCWFLMYPDVGIFCREGWAWKAATPKGLDGAVQLRD